MQFHVSLKGVVAFGGVVTVRAVPGDAHLVCQSAVCGKVGQNRDKRKKKAVCSMGTGGEEACS
ncbi:hypothetical protein E2C01_027094 [Portunus trituberculatus]|uniref:Uncharacterized protein n=1 Tax=Portunus trituberculatus TaxID=210409 RepID=A0A5B7EJZ0_PORTR|nr:hypothetical protein [Portunus trituberculatus]